MNASAMKWFVYSQSLLFFASSLIFPFYILFIKNVGSSYAEFGLAYGLFGLSGAFIHLLLSKLPETTDRRLFLTVHSFGMAFLLLLFSHITEVEQVYVIQLALGALGGFQKHGEKLLVTELTNEKQRMKEVGHYHFWTALFSSIAIMFGGILADFFTVHFIFYASSVLYLCSGFMVLYLKR